MPKKIHTNPKAVEARERKENAKNEKRAAEEKKKEDAKWVDEGSTAAERRRVEAEQQRALEAKKRAEKKALQQKEQEELAKISAKGKLPNAEKMTRAELLRDMATREAERKQAEEQRRLEAKRLVAQPELTPNINHVLREQAQADLEKHDGGVASASGVDEALGALSVSENKEDRHPEKRMKSAWALYEEKNMPILKAENPTLKFTQLKEMLWRQWQKSPENPLVAQSLLGARQADPHDWRYVP